ncbi:sensor histidine kinase [Paenibacillus sp. ISL-20]|uniref:sensor histidine kinase n=1 Tax=Paenibacillus sp. ISL-20 TaxID=2819163 RepID=UPI001BE6F87F|nr:sensor histidine kinase [Paenibacillus sp. ISL-20]MBT2763675.1 sensor histidine kinase [Paenibacillus sp. ISL-20]
MKPSLNNVRLRDKMLLMYFLAVFLPILVTNLIFYNVTSGSVREQRIQDITVALEQMKNEFRREVEDALEISSVFYTDIQLNEIVETVYDHPADYIEAYDTYLRRILNSGSAVYNSVSEITVYVDNPTLLYSGGINYIDDQVKEEAWYKAIAGKNVTQPIVMRTGKNGQLDSFSIIRSMNYFSSQNDHAKYLKIDMRMPSIRQIMSNLNVQGKVYLLSGAGNIEYTTDPKVDVMQGSVPYSSVVHGDNFLEFHTDTFTTNNLNSWTVMAVTPEDVVLRDVHQSLRFVVVLTCLNFLLPTLVIVWISRSLNVRLVRILKHMKKVKNQHYDTIQEAEARDEIGQLTGEFNRMTLQLKSLINDVYVADIQKKNLELQRRHAQLNALQSQINPHFLFNALETIRMRSLMKDEDETARIIHNMAKIFRNSLVWKKDMVTLKEEVEFIHCFLEIQKYRFGDKIDYSVHAPAEEGHLQIPKMAIVTFVENASIHGIEPLKHGGRIEVHIAREGQALICNIQDNGAGMSAEQVEHIYRYLDTEDEMGERIGIQNVIYRLKLYYGSRFQFEIDSSSGQGTRVRLSIPIET